MNYQLIQASAHDTGLPTESVHAVITSPPYFGLRSYDGDQAIKWPAVEYAPMPGLPEMEIEPMTCGLGEEPTPEAYIGHLVLVMREMWRVLRDDGAAWVNLGDSYAGSGGYSPDSPSNQNGGSISARQDKGSGEKRQAPPKSALRAKSKILIPHRFALAMQAEGWIVRQDIVWAKGISCLPDYAGSCMPESVRDRPTNGHEYVFLLAKQGRYYYDAEAVKEAAIPSSESRYSSPFHVGEKEVAGMGRVNGASNTPGMKSFSGTRNLRSVWALNPGSYPGAHFATFPERLPELMVLAGTSAKGVCPKCGAPWERVVERTAGKVNKAEAQRQQERNRVTGGTESVTLHVTDSVSVITTGWRPTCDCDAGTPIPATVLDMFNGAGTTGLVAMRHTRDYIGIDLSDAYFEQTRQRFTTLQPMLPGVMA